MLPFVARGLIARQRDHHAGFEAACSAKMIAELALAADFLQSSSAAKNAFLDAALIDALKERWLTDVVVPEIAASKNVSTRSSRDRRIRAEVATTLRWPPNWPEAN